VFVYWDFCAGNLFLCPTPFVWGGSSVPPALSTVCVLIQFAFQFSGAVWFWMLLAGSGDHFCDLLPALLWRVAYYLPALSLYCLSCVSSVLRLAPCPSPSLQCSFSVPPALSTLFDYSSLFVIQFCWGASVCPGTALVYVPGGGWGSSMWCVMLTYLFCQMMCRQVWSQ
jgi:hypothetical protein